MFNYLQSSEGVRHILIVAGMLAFAALVFGVHPFKKKKLKLATAADPNLWMAGDYYTFLYSLILASRSLDKLQETMPLIDGFFDKGFRIPISTIARKRYYSRLLESYCKKESELTHITVELCRN